MLLIKYIGSIYWNLFHFSEPPYINQHAFLFPIKTWRRIQMAEELTPTKIEQLNKMPIVESSVGKSDDGKWVIHRTVITSIKPIKYYQKMLESA